MKFIIFCSLIACMTTTYAKSTAIVNVNVIPMTGEGLVANQAVVFEDGVIVFVGPATKEHQSIHSQVLDGNGMYLIPGLIDAHVHLEHLDEASDMLLFLQHGITTVRNMDGRDHILEWQREQALGNLLAPNIVTASPVIDGHPPIWNDTISIATEDAARKVVAQAADDGYQQIKVYTRLSRDNFNIIVEEARRRAIPVVGHVPSQVGLEHAVKSGLYSIEHLSGYVALLEPEQTSWHPHKRFLAANVDWNKLDAVIALVNRSGVWNCPTLVMHENSFVPDNNRFHATNYKQLSFWRYLTWLGAALVIRDTAPQTAIEAARKTRLHLTKALAQNGRLLLGTDAGIPFVFPGVAAHEELDLMVRAGLTPYEALKAATAAAGKFLEKNVGTIDLGQKADFVLLRNNPLENIRHTREVEWVVINGVLLNQQELQSIEASVAW